jgi:hypothetical protein
VSPSARCDEILRLIDDVLEEAALRPGRVAASTPAPRLSRTDHELAIEDDSGKQ